ncbi:MAG: hypothetical protein WA432_02390 [Candidatus Babeliaceae bacterium]
MSKYESFVDGICEILDKNKVLKQRDFEALKKDFHNRSDITFDYFLLSEGIVAREDLLQALSEFYECPALDIKGIFFDHHLVRMFPKDEMLRNDFIPYERDGDILIVIARDPNNATLSAIIGQYVSYDVTYFAGLAQDIEDAVEEYYDASLTEQIDDQIVEEEEIIEREEIKEINEDIGEEE